MTLFSIEPSPFVVVGPFTVNYNSPNVLTTGVPLWTPEAGYVIYNMWFRATAQFAATGGTSAIDIVLQTANDVLFASYGAPYLSIVPGYGLDTGTDVSNNVAPDVLAGQVYGNLQQGYFPTLMKVTTPIKLKLVPNTGTLTAGVLNVYAMVGELS